jgi:hypothetical protein
MQRYEFEAVCPYEIDDMVLVGGEWAKIDDILCIHSAKTGDVTFELRVKIDLDGGVKQVFSLKSDSNLITKSIPNHEVEARRNEWEQS